MTTSISYMGTKRELASSVADVILDAKQGVLLDAFAGMGAIAEAMSPHRNVWTNDIQHFAHLVGKCLFTSTEPPPRAAFVADELEATFARHVATLNELAPDLIELGKTAVSAPSAAEMVRITNEVRVRSATVPEHPYSCFLTRYAGGYFSVAQTIEIDALRFALDEGRDRELITPQQHDWCLMALGRACLKVANTPGHFAQYLRPNETSFHRIQRQGRRSIWSEWLIGVDALTPVGSRDWRSNNRATQSDSLGLLSAGSKLHNVSVVYCDPPYTDDQYSRFYHIWETLVLYDYPDTAGVGQYRPDRFTTPFSLKTKVKEAFEELIARVSDAGADMVLSYPTNGLLHQVGCEPIEIMKKRYPKAKLAVEFSHNHSTFGASKGVAKSVVKERIYLAKR